MTKGGRRCYHCDNCDVALQDAAAAHGVPSPSAQPALGLATIECAQLTRVLLRSLSNAQDNAPGPVAKSAILLEMRKRGSGDRPKRPSRQRGRWPAPPGAGPSAQAACVPCHQGAAQ